MGGSAQGDRPLSRRASAQPSSSAPRPPPLPRLIAAQRGRRNVDHRRDRATCIRRDDRGTHRDRDRVRLVAAQGRPRADPPRLHDRGGDASWHRSPRLVADPASGRPAPPLRRRARCDRALPVVRRADTHRPGSDGAARCADSPSRVGRRHQGAGCSTCSRAGCTASRPPTSSSSPPCRSASRR